MTNTAGPAGARDGTSGARDGSGSPLIVPALLAFFDRSARDLPWRATDVAPWAVLVSEVMLQQTPVARVLPVYTEWLRRWPRPVDLAAATPGDAVRAWGRLGYPRRALRLHEAASVIVTAYDGRVPSDITSLLALPGIGDYTARAVAVFAFGHRAPVVDTNVRRVLCRAVRGIDEHRPATAADRAHLDSQLPTEPDVAARFSAALMELGALICTASSPDCGHCPLSGGCAWRAAGYPAGPPRRPVQGWHGTDRQARGRLMAVLREQPDPVPPEGLDLVWPDAAQRDRALAGLLADRLAMRTPDGQYALPGHS